MPKFEKKIPILQSSLPPFERMVPYLEKIEGNRCHSNFGKLFRLFEERMADFFGLSVDEVVLVANGTLALIAGLLALEIPAGKYCLMPSWTFSATPASAALSALKPFFLDVDPITQTLTPEHVLEFLHHSGIADEIGAVMVVSPFGAPISSKKWDDFSQQTNIPVLIDAAASFDTVHRIPSMKIGFSPTMVSLHATKVFGIGEGGMLLSKNTDLIKRVKGISNFGFDVSRVSSYLGMNAKMSEYQAAIGLAVLDSWDEIRKKRFEVTCSYINLFNRLKLGSWLSTDWVTSTCNVLIPGKAEEIRDYLNARNIESRIWWGKGCHTYRAYHKMPTEPFLTHTEQLSNTMLGLPFSIDTSNEEIHLIGTYLEECLEQNEATLLPMHILDKTLAWET